MRVWASRSAWTRAADPDRCCRPAPPCSTGVTGARLSSDGSNDDWLNKPPYTNTGPNNVPANDDDGYVVPLASSTNTGTKGKWGVGRAATRANYTENQPDGFGFEQPAHSGMANALGSVAIQAMAGRTGNTNNDDSEDEEMNC